MDHMVTPQPFVWMFIDMHQMMWSTNNKVKWNISFPSSGNSNHQLSQELFFVSLMMFTDSEQLLFYSLTIPVAATQHLNQMYQVITLSSTETRGHVKPWMYQLPVLYNVLWHAHSLLCQTLSFGFPVGGCLVRIWSSAVLLRLRALILLVPCVGWFMSFMLFASWFSVPRSTQYPIQHTVGPKILIQI